MSEHIEIHSWQFINQQGFLRIGSRFFVVGMRKPTSVLYVRLFGMDPITAIVRVKVAEHEYEEIINRSHQKMFDVAGYTKQCLMLLYIRETTQITQFPVAYPDSYVLNIEHRWLT